MSGEDVVDDGDVVAWLAGADGPRPLPDDLADDLTGLLRTGDPVARLAGGASGAAPALPPDLRDRLAASVLTTGEGSGHTAMPSVLRRRLVRALDPATHDRTALLRVAAVVVAVLVVSGGLAFASIRDGGGGDGGRRTDLAVEPGGERPGEEHGFDGLGGVDVATGEEGTATDGASSATTSSTAGPTATTAAPRPRPGAPNVPPPAGDTLLVAYANCEDLLGRTKAAALEVVGPYGLASGPSYLRGEEATAAPSASAAQGDQAATDGGDAGEASTTNVQEAGVDEPDIVKSDARRVVTVVGNSLRVLRNDGGRLTSAGVLTLPDGAQGGDLLVDGDRALVFGWKYDAQPQPQPAGRPSDGDAAMTTTMPMRAPQAAIWTVDLRDPSALRIESTLLLDGAIAAARLADGRVRVALTTTTIGPDWVYPTDGSEEAQRRALAENRRRVEQSTTTDWLPSYTLLRGTDPATARRGQICACDDTLRPEDAFAGASTMSVLTLDPQRPDQPPTGSAAVQGWAETVYASRTNLFVTTRAFASRFDASLPTAVHRFDIADPARATYRGSGEVRGVPLNQFALSERGGHLRIATTDAAGGSESFVSSLAVRLDRLEQVGQVGGLGKGERIFAVRFLDDVGYVVTFRQTDPLYTVDLRDPTAPRVRGELKIPGFSAYLHPTSDGRLVGVGQDATDTGRATGAQMSSFDVRDLAQPRETARIGFGDRSSSEVQHDHHAFLYWAAARRAMVPVQRYDTDGRSTSWLSVVHVPDDGVITEAGRVTHDGRTAAANGQSAIRRSFVVGDVLYTLSAGGVLASDLHSLAERSWLAF